MSVKVGDEVYLEECWEDAAGDYHDEFVTVARVLPDGTFKVRLPDGRKRWKVQAYLNQQEWVAAEYEPEAKEEEKQS